MTAEIALRVPNGYVLGVDKWYHGVIQSILRFPREAYPNLRFFQADARSLKLEEEPFDFVVSRSCLHFLDHPGHAFRPIAKRLKPGGNMHIWCMGRGNAAAINKSLTQLIHQAEWQDCFRDFRRLWSLVTPISCDPWLSAARLKKNYSRLVKQEVPFSERGEFLRWVSWSWSNFFERVPPARRQRFQEQFMALCLPSSSQPVAAHLVWLVIDATKI